MNNKLFLALLLTTPMIFSMHNDENSNLPNRPIAIGALQFMYNHPFFSAFLAYKSLALITRKRYIFHPRTEIEQNAINQSKKATDLAVNITNFLATGSLGMIIKSLTHYKLVEDDIPHSHSGLLFDHDWLKNQKCLEQKEAKKKVIPATLLQPKN